LTESYISAAAFPGRKAPPAVDRTDLYDQNGRFPGISKRPSLFDGAAQRPRVEKKLPKPPAPLFPVVRE